MAASMPVSMSAASISVTPPRPQSSLLSDALVRSLVAAGQADVLVAIPTLNHAATAGAVARAVLQAFTGPFARQRTVLLNPDGGSTDGTSEIMLRAGAASGDLLVTSYPLRTVHRITAPYHGVPGRGSAVALAFAAADLLGARAVAIVDPEATELDAGDLTRFLRPILDGSYDFIKPVLPRNPEDGPLVSQLVRPLFRACYGRRILEPVDTLLVCSGEFASSALEREILNTPFAHYGLDPWLCVHAIVTGSRIAQVPQPPHSPRRNPAEFVEVFQQVIGSVFALLADEPERWQNIRGSVDVPTLGPVALAAPSATSFDTADYAEAFRQGVDALKPLLCTILPEPTFQDLGRAAASSEAPRLDDHLWARIVYDFIGALLRQKIHRDQLVGCLQPIYLGRVCTWLQEIGQLPRAAAEGRSEALCRVFEEQKASFVDGVAPSRKEQG